MKVEKEFDELKNEMRFISKITLALASKEGRYKRIGPLLNHALQIKDEIDREYEQRTGKRLRTIKDTLEENRKIQFEGAKPEDFEEEE